MNNFLELLDQLSHGPVLPRVPLRLFKLEESSARQILGPPARLLRDSCQPLTGRKPGARRLRRRGSGGDLKSDGCVQ